MPNNQHYNLRTAYRLIRRHRGFTLLELMITIAIIGIISSIATLSYNGYIDTTNNATAKSHIRMLSLIIKDYANENGTYPDNLNNVGNDNFLDPWGHPYQYLNLSSQNAVGMARKDHNLVPLNTHFDLYSKGKDGQSFPPINIPVSKDDIIFANDGEYIGIAKDY